MLEVVNTPEPEVRRPLWKTVLYFAAMIGILVFANWGKTDEAVGFWYAVHQGRWLITPVFAVDFAAVLVLWFGLAWWKVGGVAVVTATFALALPREPMVAFVVGAVGLSIITAAHEGEVGQWFASTWIFAKQILPLLLFGVLVVAGFLLGRPGHEGVTPNARLEWAVGGNSLWANLFASVVGAFMYVRHADRGADPARVDRFGDGQGAGPVTALGRPSVVIAFDARASLSDGNAEDRGLLLPGGRHGHDQRHDVRGPSSKGLMRCERPRSSC